MKMRSFLEVYDMPTGTVRRVLETEAHIEAPNWSLDGKGLIFNSSGLLYTIPVAGDKKPQQIKTGDLNRSNNDHGISPDGKWLVISDQSNPDNQSRMYILPIEGGEPRLVTAKGPSYWHGWSPDGRTLAYVAHRPELVDDYEIFAIDIDDGEEIRLTDSEGLDDGPDYSPDGKYIYFNSVRSGNMKIWRMDADGKNPLQLTSDDRRDWFPHPSPNGEKLVFVSYNDDVAPGDHPANKDVSLRLMSAEGGEVTELTTLFGGQGTINVPSWSPDSRFVAFVSYRLLP
jgi:Tol biopolymer transport system component